MFITTQNILRLIKEKGMTPNQFAIECGLNNSAITEWKKGKANPSNKILQKIANKYDLSIAYFYEDHSGVIEMPSKPTPPPKPKTIEKLPENLTPENVIMFPIIGMIAAGYDGNVSFDPTGDEIPVPEYLLKTHNPNDYFVLQVIGNSMLPIYHNGDKVLIRKTDSVDSGTIAAVGFDTENATLKKVEYINGKNRMKLIPLNPDFPIKEIKGPDLDLCHVYGEVVYKLDNRIIAPRVDMQSNSELADKINALSPEKQRLLLELIDKMSKE